MTYRMRLAKADQPETVREFAEAVDDLFAAADPEAVSTGRAHTHSLSRRSADPGSASFDVRRTLRSRVTYMTAVIRFDADGLAGYECECHVGETICEHIAASLIKLVEDVAKDDRELMRLKGMSDKQIEAVEELRKPGRTRWAARAHTAGPDPAAALARTPGPLPAPPPLPEAAGTPDYSSEDYSFTYAAKDVSLGSLEQQAARAAKTALAALAANDD
jgi:hypothetical protein